MPHIVILVVVILTCIAIVDTAVILAGMALASFRQRQFKAQVQAINERLKNHNL